MVLSPTFVKEKKLATNSTMKSKPHTKMSDETQIADRSKERRLLVISTGRERANCITMTIFQFGYASPSSTPLVWIAERNINQVTAIFVRPGTRKRRMRE